jgi:hypothetical protein
LTNLWEKLNILPVKYHLRKLEIRSSKISIQHSLNPSYFSPLITQIKHEPTLFQRSTSAASTGSIGIFDEVQTETGYFYHHDTVRDDSLFNEDENTRLIKKTDEIRDAIEESGTRANIELRKIALSLQNELEDIKRRLIQQ